MLLSGRIGVLAIHVGVVGCELAGGKQRKKARKPEETRKQVVQRSLRDRRGDIRYQDHLFHTITKEMSYDASMG